jgi:hypothetical protein
MKDLHFIAPTLSILATGFWLQLQETALDDYEEKRQVLKAKIHKVVSKSNPPQPPPPSPTIVSLKSPFLMAPSIGTSPAPSSLKQTEIQLIQAVKNSSPNFCYILKQAPTRNRNRLGSDRRSRSEHKNGTAAQRNSHRNPRKKNLLQSPSILLATPSPPPITTCTKPNASPSFTSQKRTLVSPHLAR